MARPIKDNADYFSHDADMRDDPKIKALRRKFKHEGYSIWNMLLETITDSDNFRLKINYEIMAGDYDIEPDKLKEIVSYCVDLQLLVFEAETSIIWSKTLDNRLAAVLSKRKRDRNVVSDSDNTQSKVKKKKVKKSRVIPLNHLDYFESEVSAFESMKSDDQYIESCHMILTNRSWLASDKIDVVALLRNFVNGKLDIKKPRDDIRQHFKNWLYATDLNKLQTLAQVFKHSLNGTTG